MIVCLHALIDLNLAGRDIRLSKITDAYGIDRREAGGVPGTSMSPNGEGTRIDIPQGTYARPRSYTTESFAMATPRARTPKAKVHSDRNSVNE